ncbi:MAG: hypothetical protein ACUZ8H_12665 [Candidatus Anammoxibacter sp.]
MALGYDGKPISGYMGVYIDLAEKLESDDTSVTKETFAQLLKDVEVFRDKNVALGFGQKAPLEGPSASLGFPDMTAAEAQALFAKLKIHIFKD